MKKYTVTLTKEDIEASDEAEAIRVFDSYIKYTNRDSYEVELQKEQKNVEKHFVCKKCKGTNFYFGRRNKACKFCNFYN